MAAPIPVYDPDPIDLTPVQRQITLRNVKGSALTYAEMDKNLSSFFYSASLSGTDLLLHYTGSTVLGNPYTPTSVTVPLNPLLSTVQQLTVAGNQVGDIQYRLNNSTLGANSSFRWDTSTNRLGVGTSSPLSTLHVTNPNPVLATRLTIGTQSTSTGLGKSAAVNFNIGTVTYHSVGITNTNTTDLFITANVGQSNPTPSVFTTIGSTKVLQANSTGLGVLAVPNNALTVKGVIGVGSDTTANQGLIGNIDNKVPVGNLPTLSGTIGLLIESPKNTVGTSTGGHVVVGLNKTSTNSDYAFSVIAATNGGSYNTSLLTVKADGKVGINNTNPTQALDIVGNTTMTGNINIDGTATIVTTADSQGANTKVLTVNGSGLVQYANNLMPLGGIIMWSGSPTALPTGWALCDGTGTWGGANPIPDLRERFIVGAGGNNATVQTRNYDSLTLSYHSTLPIFTANPTIAINGRTYTIALTSATYYVNTAGTIQSGTATVNSDIYSTANGNFHVYKDNEGTQPTFLMYDARVANYRIFTGNFTGTTGGAAPAIVATFNSGNAGSYADYNKYTQYGKRPSNLHLVGADTVTYSVGDTGGYNEVFIESAQMPSHTHNVPGRNQGSSSTDGGANFPNGADSYVSTTATGGGGPHENRPPYYALAFIIYTGV